MFSLRKLGSLKILCVFMLVVIGFGGISYVPAEEVKSSQSQNIEQKHQTGQSTLGIVTTTIPEPASLTLLAIGSAMILHRKKHPV